MKYPFPKADLHFHLDGAMVPETTWRLAQERNIKLPADNIDEFKAFLVRTADCGDVGEYLARFDIPTAILQDKVALKETTYDTIKMVSDTLSYAEIRFAPQLHTNKGLTQKDAIEAVLEGKREAEKDFPQIKVNIIFCCMISFDDNHEANEETVKLFKEYYGNEVVALDLAGFEDSVPMDNYAYLFEGLKEQGYNLTIHAGDNGVPINCSKVIDWGAARIGHGHHCFYDKEVMKKVIDTKTALEICLSSNIQCKTEPSFALHPAKALLQAGGKVTLNTDNMVFSNTDIEKEYDIATKMCGFSYNDLIDCNINSFEAAFLPQQEKDKYIEQLKASYQKDIFDKIVGWKIFDWFRPIYKKYKHIFMYIFFGGCTTLINFIAYHFFFYILNINNVISTALAWLISVLFAYFTYRKYVYVSTEPDKTKEFIKFVTGRLSTGALDILFMWITVDIMLLNGSVMKLASGVFTAAINYIIGKLFVFKKQ